MKAFIANAKALAVLLGLGLLVAGLVAVIVLGVLAKLGLRWTVAL
jgi:hypothetical protein